MIELRRALPFLAIPLLLLAAACSVLPPPFAPSPTGGAAGDEIAARQRQWQAQGITSYEWQVTFSCECVLSGPTTITVADGTASEVRNPRIAVEPAAVAGFPLTVDALFAEALRTLEAGGTVEATWDEGTGLPKTMFLDRMPTAIDDELGVEISAFEIRPRPPD